MKKESNPLLIDYLQSQAEELRKTEDELKKLNEIYRKSYDKQLREEIKHQTTKLRKKRFEVKEHISKNIEEFRLLRSNFVDLFNVFLEDERLRPIILQKIWLTDFKLLDEEKGQKELQQIRERRKELKEAEDFLGKWHGEIDAKSLKATWKVFDAEIEGKLHKEELLQKLPDIDKRYVKKGWLIMINEPFVYKQLRKFSEWLKKLYGDEKLAKAKYEKSIGKGTRTEYETVKEYKRIIKERKNAENKCINMLLANPQVARKLKSSVGVMRFHDKTITNLLKDLKITPINEKEWKEEMQKRLKGL